MHPDLLQNCFKMTFVILKSKIKIEGQEEQKNINFRGLMLGQVNWRK